MYRSPTHTVHTCTGTGSASLLVQYLVVSYLLPVTPPNLDMLWHFGQVEAVQSMLLRDTAL